MRERAASDVSSLKFTKHFKNTLADLKKRRNMGSQGSEITQVHDAPPLLFHISMDPLIYL